jgi:cytochrome c biogenesis protein CcmG/thiol:disulfide interchange protein DsbE
VSNSPNRRRHPSAGRPAASNRWVVWAVLGAIALVAVLAVVIVAAGGGGNDNGATKHSTPARFQTAPRLTVDGTSLPRFDSTTRDTAVGLVAPTLDSVDFAGNAEQAGGNTGEPYALVFLAHWCPHCQAEVPRLVSLAKGGKIAGVDVVGIPTSTTDQAPNYPPSAWLARERWPFRVLLDTAKGKAGQVYGLSAFPYFVFVDASGNVAGRTSGEMAPYQVEAIFEALAKGQPLPIPGAGASSASSR